MQLDATNEAVKGSVAIAGVTTAAMTPNEIASLAVAVLTAVFVVAQFVTLLPKLLDSITNLKARWKAVWERDDDATE